ncbi:MAG: DUF1573 domain-containing protein [Prolixibacteraceae bacterium]|jgi:hypothetical protein|nr:DUF1573 domain-containing protein [Prolixibacteraceae bacterium]
MYKLILVLYLIISCNTRNRIDDVSKIEYEKKIIDIGKIEYKSNQRSLFQFKNNRSKPLKIEAVRLSCSCISAEWPKNEIFPNEVGIIEVRVDTGHLGFFREKLIVYYTEEKIMSDTLFISGNLVYHGNN